MTSLTTCPECATPAEVLDRYALASTDGPLEHAKLLCVLGHVRTVLAGELPRLSRVQGAPRRRLRSG
jgi:hypothetical protein